MGTRGCIARLTKEGFEGRYHHWDSYPSGLGETLWKLYNEYFNHDLKGMLEKLIDEHKAGWSTICGKDFNFKAGFIEDITKASTTKKPLCYCHGDRHEKEWLVTKENASGSGIEWVYAFDIEAKTMLILSSFNESGSKMIGMFGCGNEDAEWRTVAVVNLEGKEPNWEKIKDTVVEKANMDYEAYQKRKREQFLKTMIEGTLRLMRDINTFWQKLLSKKQRIKFLGK